MNITSLFRNCLHGSLFAATIFYVCTLVFSVQGAQNIVPFSQSEVPPIVITELNNVPGSLKKFLATNQDAFVKWIRIGSAEGLRQSLLRLYEGLQRQLRAEDKHLTKTLHLNKLFEDICLKHILEEREKVADLTGQLAYEKIFKDSLQRDLRRHMEAKAEYARLLAESEARHSLLSSHVQKGSDRIDNLKAELAGVRRELDTRSKQLRLLMAKMRLLLAESDSIAAANDDLEAENNDLVVENENLVTEIENLKAQMVVLEEDRTLSLEIEQGLRQTIDTIETRMVALEDHFNLL